MGNFVVEIEAVGGHGCQREIGDRGIVSGCRSDACPDCTARRFVADLRRKGNSLVRAKLIHWPGEHNQVVDDLMTGERAGKF